MIAGPFLTEILELGALTMKYPASHRFRSEKSQPPSGGSTMYLGVDAPEDVLQVSPALSATSVNMCDRPMRCDAGVWSLPVTKIRRTASPRQVIAGWLTEAERKEIEQAGLNVRVMRQRFKADAKRGYAWVRRTLLAAIDASANQVLVPRPLVRKTSDFPGAACLQAKPFGTAQLSPTSFSGARQVHHCAK